MDFVKMRSIILLLAVFSTDHTTAEESPHAEYDLTINTGILQSIKPSGSPHHLDLSNRNLKEIAANVFDNLPQLRSLDLSKNELSTTPPSIFSNLTRLETLSLADNRITRLPASAFTGLAALRSLDLSNNPLDHLQRGVFHGLQPSVGVIIEGTNISAVSTGVFQPLDPTLTPPKPSTFEPEPTKPLELKVCKDTNGTVTDVTWADDNLILTDLNCTQINRTAPNVILDGLHLKTFKSSWFFGGYSNNAIVYLRHNGIEDLTPELLNHLGAWTIFIDLAFNNLEFIRRNGLDTEDIRIIRLDYNRISTIEPGAFSKLPKLASLLLAHNRLTTLHFARSLPNTMIHLHLDSNRISYVHKTVLARLVSLGWISLRNNSLGAIHEDTFLDLKLLSKVDISNNQLRVIPRGLFETQDWLQLVNLAYNKLTHVDGAFKKAQKPWFFRIFMEKADDEWIELQHLKSLNVAGNPMDRIDNDTLCRLGKWGDIDVTVDQSLKVIEGGIAGA